MESLCFPLTRQIHIYIYMYILLGSDFSSLALRCRSISTGEVFVFVTSCDRKKTGRPLSRALLTLADFDLRCPKPTLDHFGPFGSPVLVRVEFLGPKRWSPFISQPHPQLRYLFKTHHVGGTQQVLTLGARGGLGQNLTQTCSAASKALNPLLLVEDGFSTGHQQVFNFS